ncbi:NADP-dependent 3-hydroxy acid dehydrogenase YdfG [Hasllibacter halocynthiae]|uniref:NADP-dependent 3-hydroxy acid dehydrogenase YdfG n=1 Tax=Hasllibacter halocynthiae TaxID=595589 RepID=A0A2T0X9Y1_9RHOB|nr:SDR family NAD(P)-dependent oxidoreductase [Hasllibacter halocynthiae]PRY95746.1 NADP-dependent 3-hydroxy acid dehydrogenase YdfG [Hasllibacter halocynthiae]
MPSLENRVVLITGPARNIGREIARAVARDGGHPVLAGLEFDRLERLRDEIGGRALAVEMDVTDDASVAAAFDAAAATFGRVDVVVSNAGVMGSGAVEAVGANFLDRMLAINLTGTYRVAHHAVPYLTLTRGYFLSVCSTAAVGHSPLQSHYCASKAGVYAMMDCFRQEVAHRGIDVGVLCPNFVAPATESGEPGPGTDELMKQLWGNVNAEGTGTPVADVARDAVHAMRVRARETTSPRSMFFVLKAPRLIQRLFEGRFKADNVEQAVEASRRLSGEGRSVTTAIGPTLQG